MTSRLIPFATIFTFLYLSVNAFAQIGEVKEINAAMSKGVQRGFQVLIPESNAKDAAKAWSSLMKEYDSKTSSVKKAEDYLSPTALIPSISANAINVYALFNETPEGVFLNAFFDLGSSFF